MSQKEQEEKVEEASVSTQLVLNKYNTNYEALKLADSTALAFKSLAKFHYNYLLQIDELPYPKLHNN